MLQLSTFKAWIAPRKMIILLVVLFAIMGFIFYKLRVIADAPKAYNSPENSKLLEAEPIEKVLVFSFGVKDGAKPFSVKDIQQYNGHAQESGGTPRSYTFGVIEDNNPVYAHSFSLPTVNVEEFHDDGTISGVGRFTQDSYQIVTPRFKDGSTYFIRDSKGTLLLEGTIKDVKVNDNEPDYKSTVGQ